MLFFGLFSRKTNNSPVFTSSSIKHKQFYRIDHVRLCNTLPVSSDTTAQKLVSFKQRPIASTRLELVP
jgi:hypothetical protein